MHGYPYLVPRVLFLASRDNPRNEAASGWWVPVNFSTEEEIQQVSYFQLSQTFLTILSCKNLHKCRAVESQDTGFEQVKMQDVIPKSNYILIARIKSVILKIDFRIYLEVDI